MANEDRSKKFKKITVEYTLDFYKEIDSRAKMLHIPKSQLVREAVREYLKLS